jgi:alkanesulfonate monooxygenase SsuD/methylene tetrahydromethanopterin reductase-like flavin-dependent oxidoreductase (luciferase family)
MATGVIGAQVAADDAPGLLAAVCQAEALGVPAVWATSNPIDSLTLFAAAAARTERILMGTAITRTWPRHPISMAEQAAVIGGLAPRRFRLGLGPSGSNATEPYGIRWERPLSHLRAYVKICKALLQEGAVDLDEAGLVAHARLPVAPPGVPVMASGLRRRSFEVCGEVADGAITWICPAAYVRDVALPALRAGAAKAGRPAPPLILHVPVCVHPDRQAARAALRARFDPYAQRPHYAAMFEAAGFPEVREGRWSDAMLDATAVFGSETEVADGLRALQAMDVGEVFVSPVGAGDEPRAGAERALRLVADLSR